MSGPGRGAMRVGRGLVWAAACLILSLSAHVAAGGQVHLTGGLLFSGLLLSALCVAAAQSQASFAGIAATMVGSQPALHLIAGSGTHGGDPAALIPSPLMIASHVGAGLVLSALLAGGDRVIWALAGMSRLPRIPSMAAAVPLRAHAAPVPTAEPGFVPRHLELALACLARRGPPAS